MKIEAGTPIYYTGDCANQGGFGTVSERKVNEWGVHLHIVMDEGHDFWVDEYNFSPKYLGHGGTRFVTKSAYQEWRDQYLAQINTAAAHFAASLS